MAFLLFITGTVYFIILGFSVLNIFEKKYYILSFTEQIILSFPVGSVITAVYMQILALFNINFSRVSVLFIIPISIPFIIYSLSKLEFCKKFKEKLNFPKKKMPRLFSFMLILLISIKLIYMGTLNIIIPSFFQDTLLNWNFKAKIFYYEQNLITDKKNEFYLGGSHQNYPLYTYFSKIFLANVIGKWEEPAAKGFNFIYILLLFSFLFIHINRSTNTLNALFFTYLAISLPIFFPHAISSFADVLIAFFFLGASIYLFYFIQKRCKLYLMYAGILCAISSLTKNEGFLVFMPVIFLVLVFFLLKERKPCKTKKLTTFILPQIILLAPWFIFFFSKGMTFQPEGAEKGISIHPEVIPIIFKEFFYNPNFSMFPLIAILAVIWYLYGEKRKNLNYLFFLIIVSFLSVSALFLFTGAYRFAVLKQTPVRIYLVLIPTAVYFIAQVFYVKTTKLQKTQKKHI